MFKLLGSNGVELSFSKELDLEEVKSVVNSKGEAIPLETARPYLEKVQKLERISVNQAIIKIDNGNAVPVSEFIGSDTFAKPTIENNYISLKTGKVVVDCSGLTLNDFKDSVRDTKSGKQMFFGNIAKKIRLTSNELFKNGSIEVKVSTNDTVPYSNLLVATGNQLKDFEMSIELTTNVSDKGTTYHNIKLV